MKLVHDAAEDPFPTPLDALTFRFEDIPRLLRRILDISLEEQNLSRAQWRLLAYVLRDEGMTQTELARVLELERASVGQAIDTLEKKDLVERKKAAGDRRVWRIHATKKGRDLVPHLRQTIDEIYEQVFAGFSADEISLLDQLLGRIMNNLEG